MSTHAATAASNLKMRLARLERINAIKQDGLLYSEDVMRRFGVSNPTAVADLRSVYGELPPRPVRPVPVKQSVTSAIPGEPKGIHCNFHMSNRTYEILQTAAAAFGLTKSEAIRYAIIRTFAPTEQEHTSVNLE